jgi:mitochondrial import receptor subunit TOM40
MAEFSEKAPAPTAFAPYLGAVTNIFHPMAGPVMNTYARFHGWKESMGLVQPGTVENLTKEVSREYMHQCTNEALFRIG